MNIEIRQMQLTDLEPNTGQVPGLPSNPRQWTKTDVERIAASLKETPELFEARPIIAVYYNGKYVILGGNLRYEGARHNKEKHVPVAVIPDDTPVDKMKEIVIKDNGTFGAWDFDSLANEWGDLDLTGWGVPAWETEDMTGLGEKKDLSDQIDFSYRLEITLADEAEQEKMFNELTERGYECRILTL